MFNSFCNVMKGWRNLFSNVIHWGEKGTLQRWNFCVLFQTIQTFTFLHFTLWPFCYANLAILFLSFLHWDFSSPFWRGILPFMLLEKSSLRVTFSKGHFCNDLHGTWTFLANTFQRSLRGKKYCELCSWVLPVLLE